MVRIDTDTKLFQKIDSDFLGLRIEKIYLTRDMISVFHISKTGFRIPNYLNLSSAAQTWGYKFETWGSSIQISAF